jgi:hypothetical protein
VEDGQRAPVGVVVVVAVGVVVLRRHRLELGRWGLRITRDSAMS